MKLLCLKDNKIHKVYKVRNDSVGYPHFLIFMDNAWFWLNGKHIKPLTLKDKIKHFFKNF